ncbi:sigma-54 dependent transcriptional regulator [Desulforhabdus sp. TSK]|uniref:sigma-54-dependent transcriptional regulator n=1 Tax=Desulforhabdus sp. TSK TaxID=2925014 RepID=UPI001FC889DB|nr:sigma-54 dependent transcriptional regulator [Desulforhabdus sp. TSK]GKT08516.1 sigma-54-dependent Fis family transcriptional regulator [Desulforhabdus sp. TSK]
MAKILVVDDEHSICESLEMFLSEKGHTVHAAGSASEALSSCSRLKPDVVILDIRLPDRSGMEVLEILNTTPTPPKIIMITAFHDMETTIQAMKTGAYDYIHKPLDADEIESAVDRALNVLKEDREAVIQDVPEESCHSDEIIGKCSWMREIFKTIGILCRSRTTALIQGETGTGKELIARVIHRNSPFSAEPMVTLDCSSIVETLIESELFGHEKGAFTGAVASKPGRIEMAGEGTLFLDEIGELPLNMQSKFLGFLERREYTAVGGRRVLHSRCRIIAATNRDLADMVRRGEFRKDLYYRLKVITIQIPSLRERASDIPPLAEHFLKKANRELGTAVCRFQDGVMERLQQHPWTGNVRELENLVTAAVIRSRGKVVLLDEVETLLFGSQSMSGEESSSLSLSHAEREQISKVLSLVRWNKSRAAQLLGITLPTLRSKIKEYGITPSSVTLP